MMAVPAALKGASTHKIPVSMSTWTLRDFASPLTAAGPAQDAPHIKGKGTMWAGTNHSRHAIARLRHNVAREADMGMFELSTRGFGQVFADRSLTRMVEELVANAFDENVSRVDVLFERLGRGDYRLKVTDDNPRGFEDLRDAYTVFEPSKKKTDPTKRGRFCFGEKWVIARCREVTITSTTGRLIFDVIHDKRSQSRVRTERGTVIECRLRATNDEYASACERVKHLLIPGGVTLMFNGRPLPIRVPIRSTEAVLPTVYADEAGNLRPTERKAPIEIYEVLSGEVASIFELGIPVVETGDVFHYDVRQRVPLPINRNNVHPSYLKRLRGAVLNVTADLLTAEQAANKGVTDGIAAASPEARAKVMNARFGERRYVPDFNREAGGELFAEGYTPVPPRAFDADTWKSLKEADAIQSANQLRPKHYIASVSLPPEKVTPAMDKFRRFAELVCQLTLNKSIASWHWSDNPAANNAASCGPAGDNAINLAVNAGVLRPEWFSDQPATCPRNIDLLIHELGHHAGAIDCTREHANEITKIAASLAVLMLTRPALFNGFR